MRTFGLLGYPLSHSFSRRFFAEKFQRENIGDAEYLNFSLENAADMRHLAETHPHLQGFNVTIPHKKNILPFLDEQSPAVRAIGACNCVAVHEGKWTGHNTDTLGFAQSLQPFLQAHHQQALVLGTGGAAAAVHHALRELGIAAKGVSRKPAPGIYAYADLNAAVLQEYFLVINTSPVGQYPLVEECPPIPYAFLGPQHHLFDLVYNPAETLFLQKGKAQGASVQNGYEMLVLQAEASWQIWNQQ